MTLFGLSALSGIDGTARADDHTAPNLDGYILECPDKHRSDAKYRVIEGERIRATLYTNRNIGAHRSMRATFNTDHHSATALTSQYDRFSNREVKGGLGRERAGIDIQTHDNNHANSVRGFRVQAFESHLGPDQGEVGPTVYCTVDILDDESYPWERLDTTSRDAGHTSSTRKWLDTYNDETFAFLGVLNRSDDQQDRYGFSLTRRTEFVVEFHKQHSSSHPGALQVWSGNRGDLGSVGPGETKTFTLKSGTHELRVSMANGTATQRNYEHYDVLAKAWIDDGSAAKATDLGTLSEETRTITGLVNSEDDEFDYYKFTLDRRTRTLLTHVEGARIDLRNTAQERLSGVDNGLSGTVDLEAGTYYVVVQPESWETNARSYESTITVSVPKPAVTDVAVTSQPRVGDTYGRGETVEVQVTFDRKVVVSGLPVVGLDVGSDYGAAKYTSGSGTKVLTFHYEVGEDHTDTDGISIRPSDSALRHGFVGVGSSITDEEFGSTANRAYSRQSDLSGHKVDGTVERAPSKPTGLTTGPATPTTVPLSWTAPEHQGATVVTGYKVEWSLDGNDVWSLALANTGSDATSWTHTGLAPSTTYYYRVSAINSVGIGAVSDTASATTPALPVATISASVDTGGNPVTAVTEGDDANFTLTFTGNVTELSEVVVRLTKQGGFFAGGETTSEERLQASNLPPGQLELHLTTATTADALDEADGSVTATIKPGDEFTIGNPRTATVTILDDDEVPEAIGDLAASPGDEQVILSWSPPMDAGTSPVVGFDYRVSDDGTMNWSNWTDTRVDPGTNNPAHTVTSLDNGTQYTFEVWARSAAGDGPPSNQVSATPLPPPVLTSIELTSDAGSDDTYAIGDDIVATVTFDRTLQVDTGNGSPALTLTIGNGTGDATCALAADTKILECTYTVVGDDEDTDGVSIGANQLAPNGGRIHGIYGATGGDANLTHAALGSDDSHKVDGVRPTLQNASVNGIALTLEWSETLDTGSAPAAGQFVLGVDSGTAPTVGLLTMSGTIMTLTLASEADATRDYSLAYTVPSSNPVKDLAGNEAATFTGTEVETVQITWSFTLTSPQTDGTGNPLVVEGGATATATVSITNGVTTTVAQKVKLQWDGTDIGGDSEPGRLLTTAGVGPTITVPAGDSSASVVISVRGDALYAPTHTAAFTASHLGTQIGSVDLTLADDDEPPVMTIAVSASSSASDTRITAITINEGGGFHLEITLDRGFATFQHLFGSAITVTAPSGTFNAGDLASMPPSFARSIKTFGAIINSTDNTTAAGAVDAVFTIAPGVDGRYTVGTPASATVRILDNDAVPTMPRSLSAKEDDREVALRWELPASYNDIELTGYQYRARERGGAWSPDWTRIPDSEATTTSHTVTGLTNGTEYTFEVRGINSKGGGPAASVDGTPLDVGIRFANHSVEEGESTTLRILPPGAPFDVGVEKILTIVLAGRGGADRPRVATDYTLRRGATPFRHSNRAFGVPGLGGAQPHFTLPMPPLLEDLTLTLETIEDEVAECREELFAYAWIHDVTDPTNRTRFVADPKRSDNLFIEDDDRRATLESATIHGDTVTLTLDQPITEIRAPSDPNHPLYDALASPPQDYFSLFTGNSAPSKNAVGTTATGFSLSGRVVTLTFPEAVGENATAWVRYDRFSKWAPLGKPRAGRCGEAIRGATWRLGDDSGGRTTTDNLPTLSIADGEGTESVDASVDFVVTLSTASSNTVTVNYATTGGSALADNDFTSTSGTLVFDPNITEQTISVPIVDDRVEDSGDTFAVTLSSPTNATIADATATGTIRNSEGEPTTPSNTLRASFVSMPGEHAGPGERFTFELAFSESPHNLSLRTVRDDAFNVNGGDIRKAQRLERPSNIRWRITVEPSGWGDVSLTLPGGRACTASGAICTGDHRMLSHSPSATVQGPAALSVADANAHENTDAALNFAVTLDRALTLTVTVDYATSNGTATAGEDYTSTSGTLTFAPGDVAKTVSVPLLDDAIDEGEETMTFTLSNASNARIANGTATGTIVNSDPLQKAWIARFGRTVASQVVDAIADRFSGGGTQGVTIAGQRLDLTGGSVDETILRTPGLAELAEPETEPKTRAMTGRELLLGSSFSFAGGGEDGALAWGAWGGFATRGFEAEIEGMRLEGDVTTGLFGADVSRERWLAGIAVSVSEADGPFRLTGAMASNRRSGTVESSLTAVYPYAKLGLSDRMEAWGIVGLGTGKLTIEERGGTPIETDLGMTMGAVGTRGELLSADAGRGLDLAIRSDAMWVRMKSDAVSNGDGSLAAAEADVSRLRLILEGSRTFAMEGERSFTPRGEIGVRHDMGDAEKGTGIEVGTGVKFAGTGFSVEGAVRALVAHEESGYEEWGASGSVRIDPDGSGRGLSLTLTPTWGNASSAAGRLWSAGDAQGLGARDETFEAESRLEAQVGYGFSVLDGRGVATPHVGWSRAGESETVRLGQRLMLGASQWSLESELGQDTRSFRAGYGYRLGSALDLNLEAARHEPAGDETPGHEVQLRVGLRW